MVLCDSLFAPCRVQHWLAKKLARDSSTFCLTAGKNSEENVRRMGKFSRAAKIWETNQARAKISQAAKFLAGLNLGTDKHIQGQNTEE